MYSSGKRPTGKLCHVTLNVFIINTVVKLSYIYSTYKLSVTD